MRCSSERFMHAFQNVFLLYMQHLDHMYYSACFWSGVVEDGRANESSWLAPGVN